MKTDEELKIIINKILSLKGKDTDFCPNCGKETKYAPNPYYYHKCETCGTESYMGNLIHKFDIDYMIDVLKQEFLNQ